VTFDESGNIFTGTADGNIMEVSAGDESVEVYARVGGRPLGLAFDKNGNLVICDALKGLISVDPRTRQTTILASHVGDSPISYCDDLEIAKSGKIYFSDATAIGPVHQGSRWDALSSSIISILSNDPTGRLLEYDPETKSTRVLIDGLVFANGVTLSSEEDYVLVTETGRPSIHRYYISGPQAGQSDYFAENLPGIPDGITFGKDGRVYVCLFSLRSPLEILHPFPLVKKFLSALLPVVHVTPKQVGCLLVMDENGNFIETLWDPSGTTTHSITHVHEHEGKLFMGSLATQWISVY
jgi:sugar lactone lactonase YvrE